jgi:hypothetical protein
MILQLIVTSIFVAGIAVCWRNLQTDLPCLSKLLNELPWGWRKPLTCGFCFTFWVALVTTLIANPLTGVSVSFNANLPASWFFLTDIFVGWVTVGMLAVIVRFGYVVLQELVYYQVHHLRHNEHQH